ncbi:tRNA (adenosine(37)-N6)-dimethylallyltransferase MiaA [Subsaxibacter sp. CAU 1640]|uniref:tRNA (adenosine(37)-N6)-dimethylallyltransferase MiaA n=1 Tax=Subsaxibacter sp. CAU 1640 TaxID=2933271 RepID=UPI0020051153|nr:tRNA (adenosine(37)-N6)-dimethylallyltransferase MiaA [Subsaxibacter sp. CAU 1640]MCK7590824.1 tRNA (adenosine(37)-N6)-dimethylallyltransferase MiaA [Subsaxibacter sp. CAU 1640]
MKKEKYLISIVGPTAIGKTALSIKLANHFKTEIISADSRQFFKEMSIGTAAPTSSELSAARHHFIHHKSVKEDYNVGEFERDAIEKLNYLFKEHDVVIMVGGSGLYVDAVVNGLDDFPNIDPNIREFLNLQLETNGLEYLQNKLKELDPISYQNTTIDNPHRVIRALEVSIGTGKPYSSFLNQKKSNRNFNTISIGLDADRQTIYNRINLRVDKMVKEGLLEEVKALLPMRHLNALNTVGYKELFHYLNGECTLEFAVSEIKKNSRRFAKRQLTWFRKNKNILWFDFESDIKNIIKAIENQIEKV